MSNEAKVVAAVASGYLLGRTKKMKLAITIGSMLAGQRVATSPRGLLKQGQELVESNPELAKIQDQIRDKLFEAAKAAAVATLSSRLEMFSDSLRTRTDDLRGLAELEAPSDESEEAEEPEEGEEEPEEPRGGRRGRRGARGRGCRGRGRARGRARAEARQEGGGREEDGGRRQEGGHEEGAVVRWRREEDRSQEDPREEVHRQEGPGQEGSGWRQRGEEEREHGEEVVEPLQPFAQQPVRRSPHDREQD